jgi:hypothetical protein
MNSITKKIEKRLDVIFNQFIEEKIGSSHVNLMPTKDKIPVLKSLSYNKHDDVLEVLFKDCNNCKPKKKGNVDFIEDTSGDLVAIRIRQFSKLNAKNAKINIYTTIENEIKTLSMEITSKINIQDNVVDKRKLMFMGNILKYDYKDLKRKFIRKLKQPRASQGVPSGARCRRPSRRTARPTERARD